MSHNQSIPLITCIAYSVPYIAANWLIAPMGLLQGIYTKYYGLSLITIATLILAVRLLDIVTDPLVGYYSDRYYQRTGTRKPFIVAGGLLLILSGYFLYVPTDLMTFSPLSKVSGLYFSAWSTVFFLGFTFFDVSHVAWANDLSPTANDKTRLFGFRAAAVYVGLALFYSVPLLPFFESRDITPDVLRVSAIAVMPLMLVCLYTSLKVAPDRYNKLHIKQEPVKNRIESNEPFVQVLKSKFQHLKKFLVFIESVGNNKPLLLVAGALLFKYVGAGMFGGMLFIYVDVYLGLGHYFAQTLLFGFAVSLVSIPLWQFLARHFGKKYSWISAMTLALLAFVGVGLLEPGMSEYYVLLVNAMLGAAGACTWSITAAMFAEVVDYSHWKYRAEQTATYFALYTFLGKFTGSLAMSLGLGIAGWYGLDVAASSHDEQSVHGLRLVMSWIPAGFTCLALMFIALSPINDRRHRIIRRRLDSLAARRSQEQTNRDSITEAAETLIGKSHKQSPSLCKT